MKMIWNRKEKRLSIENSINITEDALNKIVDVIKDEENPDLKLRLYISGGGCSGLQYGFAFETKIEDDDYIIKKSNVTFLVDNVSFQYLDGASIDYISDLKGSQFVVKNPNAKSTCSCGSSFVA